MTPALQLLAAFLVASQCVTCAQIQQQMGNFVTVDLVGMYIEQRSLKLLDQNAILESSGISVAARLKELEDLNRTIKATVKLTER